MRYILIYLKNTLILKTKVVFRNLYYCWRYNLLINIGSLVSNSHFGEPCKIGKYSIVTNSNFGAYSYVANNSSIDNTSIGRYCSIGSGVYINPGNHPIDLVSTSPYLYGAMGVNASSLKKRITIGNNVWIGNNCLIMGGVDICECVIVAAGSIVTKSISKPGLYVGCPAVFYRSLQTIQPINWSETPDAIKNSLF